MSRSAAQCESLSRATSGEIRQDFSSNRHPTLEPLNDDHPTAAAGAEICRLRLGSIGADCLDGINGNDWRREQFAGAGDVLGDSTSTESKKSGRHEIVTRAASCQLGRRLRWRHHSQVHHRRDRLARAAIGRRVSMTRTTSSSSGGGATPHRAKRLRRLGGRTRRATRCVLSQSSLRQLPPAADIPPDEPMSEKCHNLP